VAGPAGVAGVAGSTGPAGPAGPAGAPGAPGPSGTAGATGPSGPAGPQGVQGLPGLGFEGTYSSTTNYGLNDVVAFGGSSYISLAAGNHGNTPGSSPGYWTVLAAQGATGAAGPQGPQGTAGAAGIQGPAGPQGPAGANGANGAAGTPGLVYQGAYASTSNYALGDVVLWQGSSWASLVASNHGNTPSLSPAFWGILTAQGPAGPTGAQGPQGLTGATGATGSTGPPGERGDQGPQGVAGTAGAQGIPGTTGAQGLSGPAGPQGPAGPVGITFQGTYTSTANYALADGVTYNGSGYVSLVASNHGNTPDQSPGQWALFAAAGAAGPTGASGPVGPVGPAGATGAIGAAGPTGAAGPAGPQGPAGGELYGPLRVYDELLGGGCGELWGLDVHLARKWQSRQHAGAFAGGLGGAGGARAGRPCRSRRSGWSDRHCGRDRTSGPSWPAGTSGGIRRGVADRAGLQHRRRGKLRRRQLYRADG
jgi:hypothetical protein